VPRTIGGAREAVDGRRLLLGGEGGERVDVVDRKLLFDRAVHRRSRVVVRAGVFQDLARTQVVGHGEAELDGSSPSDKYEERSIGVARRPPRGGGLKDYRVRALVRAMGGRKIATYEDVLATPRHLVAEIVAGTLRTHARPRLEHAAAASALGEELGPPFRRGRGGPGG